MSNIMLELPAIEMTGVSEALTYRAPFLIEKLLKEQIVETPQAGEELFTEVIRYLILQRCYPEKGWTMFSRRIDEVWHQFVLFTVEYEAFCNRYFGGYVHHFPSNAPMPAPDRVGSPPVRASWSDFVAHYQRLLGIPLPELWNDENAIKLGQRVLRAKWAQELAVADTVTQTVTLTSRTELIFEVTEFARPALEFISNVKSFYVRELPGDLTDDERIEIVKILVARRVLLLAP